MKRLLPYFIFIFFGFTQHIFAHNLIKDFGIEANFATMKLLGNTMATKMQIFQKQSSGQIHSGGGLQFIQPGLELAAIGYFGEEKQYRGVAGVEFIWLTSKERIPFALGTWLFAKHELTLMDFSFAWHYVFWNMQWQDAKLYVGPELMCNFMLQNDFNGGTNYSAPDIKDQVISTSKDMNFRLGLRTRIGVEGKLQDNWYFNGSFSVGAYNLLGRNDETGELFNMKNDFDKKEYIQYFYNINIGFQYKF